MTRWLSIGIFALFIGGLQPQRNCRTIKHYRINQQISIKQSKEETNRNTNSIKTRCIASQEELKKTNNNER